MQPSWRRRCVAVARCVRALRALPPLAGAHTRLKRGTAALHFHVLRAATEAAGDVVCGAAETKDMDVHGCVEALAKSSDKEAESSAAASAACCGRRTTGVDVSADKASPDCEGHELLSV
jgi:hypothetical protein